MSKEIAIRTGESSPPLLFRQVSPGPSDSTLQFRLLHFWNARKNVKGGPEILLGVEMLMIDAEGTLAQGFIGQNRRSQYEKELERGRVYTLTTFYASNSKVMYHVADQRLVICISHDSALSKDEEDVESILTERFRVHSFSDFEANCDLRGDLHDVVGHLKLVDGQALHQRPVLCTKDGSVSRKVTVHLQLKDGPVVNVYLWDEAAESFRLKFDASATTPTVLLVTTVNPKRLGAPSDASSSSEATNNPILECPSCGALVWQSESTGRDPKTKELRFTICCNQGQIKLPPMRQPPPVLEKLLQCKQFRETIRVYNALLAFTSIGANIDYSVVFGRGPFTFRIQGKTYHRIGSLIPKPGLPPRYLQLYIFDTANEVKNRLEALGQTTSEGKATEATLKVLIEMVDTNNCLAKVFRRVRDRYEANSEEDFTISLISDKGKGKQYDLPQSSEVVGLIVGEMADTICERDIYPLLFPYGEYGFNTEIPLHLEEGSSRTRKFVSIRQFYASQIQTRLKEGMTLIKSGRLLHQYVVDVYSSIEEDRLRWHRLNQDVLRAELYSNVCDAVGKGDTDARTVGKRFILPPSFTGGPRYLIEKYHDAMAICRQFGNPDLFITMTANPNWKEIKDHLAAYGGDSPNDRPDIECRVFKMKLDQLLDDFKKGTFFAPYTAALHRIEFQKRGLPHAHILLWFGDHSRTPSPEEIDKIISAELPDKQKDPEAYELVAKHMIHGPCGLDRPRSPCMENHVCAKKFPRPFTESTSIDKSGYIIYRRRKNENAKVLKDGILLDNASVIPYNIEILKKYAAHINVEWCNRTSAIKYLFKYITKGVDRATVLVEKGPDPPTSENGSDPQTSEKGKEKVKKARNEIKEYQDCRYLSACESMWRTFAYSIHKRQPSVMKLVVHLEGEHNITIKDTDNLGRVIQKPGIEKTMFTEWMVLCRTSAFARTLTYVQIPEFFTWNNSSKVRSERKRGTSIGRVVTVHPASGDRYYLRILINKVKGPRSYTELRTFNGVTYPDFKSTCCARGLLANDAEWHESMAELNTWGTPSQLREMFVKLLIYCHVANPKELWDKCWKTLSEDILYKKRKEFKHPQLEIDDAKLEQYTLLELEKALRNQEHTLTDFPGMPTPDPLLLKELGNTLWQQELQYNVAEEKSRHDTQYTLLNREQLDVYQAIIESTQEDYGKLFFVYGAGGTGKTFLYQTIISRLRSEKKIVLPVASSGIAALLLPGGRTAHSR
ncbi:unnamed protein product, partial [Brassica rapa subsp. trilocularis]